MSPISLRDRLRDVIVPGSARPAEHGEPAERVDVDLTTALGGEWLDDEHGRSFVITRRYPAESSYGRSTVGGIAGVLASSTSAPIVGGHPANGPFVFFDLETTGLSGGAGTQAFIVGCAWFDSDGSFVTVQHLLADFAHERPMLRRVIGDVERGASLVTFNGKSFDAPVIETRYLFHRLTSPCAGRPHLDLVHPARRFWSGVTSGCSLTTLEAEILGVERVDDVSGAEAPSRYFHFVRTGDVRPLAGVLEHNRRDLLSLAALAAHLFSLVDQGPQSATHAQEALALARTYERAGLDARAGASYEEAIRQARRTASAVRRQIECDALRALALGARRTRQYDAAAAWWRQLLDVPGCPREMMRDATEALAIHHEHRQRDLAAAKMFALRSLDEGNGAAWGNAVRHRLARLERKMVSEWRPLFPFWTSPPACETPTSEPRTSS